MMHARSIGIEDARNLDFQPVLAMIIEKERFGATLALVVARSDPDGVHMAPIIFGLGMNVGIAINFAGRSLKDFALQALGKAENVDGTVDGRLDRLHRIMLIVDG